MTLRQDHLTHGYATRGHQFMAHAKTSVLAIMPSVQLTRLLLIGAYSATFLNSVAWILAVGSVYLMRQHDNQHFDATSTHQAIPMVNNLLSQSHFLSAKLCLFSSRQAVRESHIKTRTNVSYMATAITASLVLLLTKSGADVETLICLALSAMLLEKCGGELLHSIRTDFGAETIMQLRQ